MSTGTPTKLKRDVTKPLSANQHLLKWVEKMAHLTKPESIHWVDGSQEEYDALCGESHVEFYLASSGIVSIDAMAASRST